MPFLKPRTIRGQLVGGLILFEFLLIALFTVLLAREQIREVHQRAEHRLQYQAMLLSVQAGDAIPAGDLDQLQHIVTTMLHATSVHRVQVTDKAGRTLIASDPQLAGGIHLSPVEQRYLSIQRGPVVFKTSRDSWEAVSPVLIHGENHGFVWVSGDQETDRAQLRSLLRITFLSGLIGVVGCTLLANLLARSITKPLGVLLDGTRQLIRDPEDTSSFPLKVSASNEAADLAMAFNLMVSSVQEQRSGLSDTLALLDSMLANAPIGFAFFDPKFRFVRINQFLADMNHASIGKHLGRTVNEIFPDSAALPMQDRIRHVFATGEAVRDLEISGELPEDPGHPRSWLVNIYPVKTGAQAVRWVGAIIVDTTARKHSEDALRKTEKLAATGRLAASIAHEINNPLEAITNLLYLVRNEPSLDEQAQAYVELAQHEVARVAEITQQTLRFYRQSTLPMVSNVSELIDSVLTLHHGRIHSMQVEVIRDYAPDADLFCFAGELRQLFTNLIGNAVDAMAQGGGKLTLTVRNSRSWADPRVRGVRVFVADTGTGMTAEVQRRIFEPFFTTKEVTGTGLGLWVSAEIIEKHNGEVRVRSRTSDPLHRGRRSGTIFMVFFPDRQADNVVSISQSVKALTE
jgi:signal transduction histidine kinase